MDDLQSAKNRVQEYIHSFDSATDTALGDTLAERVTPDYLWRGLHPFHELHGAEAVATQFWQPLRQSFRHMQRRADIFLCGNNHTAVASNNPDPGIWTCEMGHMVGLFDEPWLDIPPTHRLSFIRYAEFHRVIGERIAETAFFFDLISVMRQANVYPLPPQTGASFMYPGPRTHDGILLDPQPAQHGQKTLQVVEQMVADLQEANKIAEASGNNLVPAATLANSWHNDMIWYGPDGIGASYTIERYQHQHQYPFRCNLTGKTFNGHVARFAEGHYGCFFGWPNLTNTASGGFLGLTGGHTTADMRVVDVYRRDGDKLAENWVIIDLPHWLNMQGLDVLERMRQLQGQSTFF